MPPLLTATNLVQWAETVRSRDALPLITRRLIHFSVAPTFIDFPAGDSVNRPGYDGLLRTNDSAPWVPSGQSVWEMGTNHNPKSKANEDYDKRVAEPDGIVPADTTFVFVTPRRWQGKSDWADEKRAEGVWSDVCVIDADDLEQWLDQSAPVAAFARRLILGTPESLQDLDDLWESWATRTIPSLTPALLTAGRQDAVDRVRAWLERPASLLRVRGDTTEEALGFITAVIRSLEEPFRERVLSRSVIVSTPEAWRAVAGGNTPTYVIAASSHLGAERAAVSKGHHVAIPFGNDAAGLESEVTLRYLGRNHLETALRGMGVEEQQCRTIAAESRGRLSALIDLLGGGSVPPSWALPTSAPLMIPLLLAGSWSETSHDLEAVARLGRISPDELTARLARWRNEADPPIRLVGRQWEWVSRRRAWPYLCRFITAADLQAFRKVAVEVLGEHDPRYEVAPDDRWRAAVIGASRQYSDALRGGLAESLAMVSARADEVQAGADPLNTVYSVVRELFGSTPQPNRWYSLVGVLPFLAEATPALFLELVERDVLSDTTVRGALFQGEGLSGTSQICHLLWALETVAWAPEHLARVSEVLGGLTATDPGGNTGNRPDGSLRAIFLPWRPHTSASVREKLAAIDGIYRRHPAVAFQLCLRLLPHGHGMVIPTSRPRWRSWAEARDLHDPMHDYAEYVTGLVNRMFRWAGADEVRWADLLKPIRTMPTDQFDDLFIRLEVLPLEEFAHVGLGVLRGAVRQILHQKRTIEGIYPDITPALEERLETVYARLSPSDPVRRHSWLFDQHPQILSVRGNDYQAEEAALQREREAAIREIVDECPQSDLLRLAGSVENARAVGYAAGQVGITTAQLVEQLSACLESAIENHREFARGLLWSRFAQEKWAWVDQLVETHGLRQWPASRLCQFAMALPFESDGWDRLQSWSEEASTLYWQSCHGWVYDATRDGPRAIRTLLVHNRPFAAFEMIGRCAIRPSGEVAIEPALQLQVLQEATAAITGDINHAETPRLDDGIAYQLGEILERLVTSGGIDEAELVRIEWAWYPLLEGSRRGPATLYRALANDPSFFAMVVRLIYRPRNVALQEDPVPDMDERTQSRATRAWRLLHNWHGLPGMNGDGAFAEQEFIDWATQVRSALSESGHAGVGGSALGDVIARLPTTSDGVWPSAIIAQWIEEVGLSDLDDGTVIGILNARGGTSRSLDAGGEQERILVARYETLAENAWATPRVAQILRHVAEHYRSDARREDEQRDLGEFWN